MSDWTLVPVPYILPLRSWTFRLPVPFLLLPDADLPSTLHQQHTARPENNRVIKISGSKLSSRGIFNVSDKLAGKDLIVEEAEDPIPPPSLYQLQPLVQVPSHPPAPLQAWIRTQFHLQYPLPVLIQSPAFQTIRSR